MSNYNAQTRVENYLGNYTDQEIGEWVRRNAPKAIGKSVAEQRRHAAEILSKAGYSIGAGGIERSNGPMSPRGYIGSPRGRSGSVSPRANGYVPRSSSPRGNGYSNGYASRTNYGSRSSSPRGNGYTNGYASRSSSSPRGNGYANGYASRTNYASQSGTGYSSNVGSRSPRRSVAPVYEPAGPEECPIGTTFVNATTVNPTVTPSGYRRGTERRAHCRNLPSGNNWSEEVGRYARDNGVPASTAAQELSYQRQLSGNY